MKKKNLKVISLIHMVLVQAKWYYYILLGLVDVEANFLGKCF